MGNRSTQELSALMGFADQVAQVEDAATALDRVEPDQGTQRVPADGEASFGTAEALATAVGASLILGPVGGILLGGAQGWLKKRSEQAVLDQMAAEQNVLTDAAKTTREQLDGFRENARPEDVELLNQLTTQMDVAEGFMFSGDQAMMLEGMARYDQLMKDMNDYATTNQAQTIEREALDAQISRELTRDQRGIYDGLQADFDAASANYMARHQAGVTVMEALKSGNPTQIHTALVGFNKLLDPNSAVLTAEKDALAGLGSLGDQVVGTIESIFQGNGMTVKQRRSMAETVTQIMGVNDGYQQTIEAEFSNRVDDAELPMKYHDNFNRTNQVPVLPVFDLPLSLEEQADAADAAAREKQMEGVQVLDSMIESAVGGLNEFVTDTAEGAKALPGKVSTAIDEAGAGIARGAERTTNFIDNLARFGAGGVRGTNE